MDASVFEVKSVREIVLSGGRVVHVDSSDYEMVVKHAWQLSPCGRYAVSSRRSKYVRMHRLILSIDLCDPQQVDHVDGNGLNNCRSNLRLATAQSNAWNRRLSIRNKSSRYKAVGRTTTGLWAVRVRSESRCWAATFEREEAAGRAYDVVAYEWFGEYANLNFPGEIEASRQIVAAELKRKRVKKGTSDEIVFRHITEATR